MQLKGTELPSVLTPERPRLKYKEYAPHIELSFWYELEQKKLHEWRLQELVEPLTLFNAVNVTTSSIPANTVSLRRESLGNDTTVIAADLLKSTSVSSGVASATKIPYSVPTLIRGRVQNFNNVEKLQRLHRREALWSVLRELMLLPLFPGHASNHNSDDEHNEDATDDALERAWVCMNFALAALFTYADLKNHRFHYMMAFPVLDLGSPVYVKHSVKGGYLAIETDHGISYLPSRTAVDHVHVHLLEMLRRHPERGPNPFIVTHNNVGVDKKNNAGDEITIHSFTPHIRYLMKEKQFVIVMADSSPVDEFPGWSARNVIGALRLANPSMTSFVLYCVRHNDVDRSVVFDCCCDPLEYTVEDVMSAETEVPKPVRVVGWTECRGNTPLYMHFVDLSAMMAPERLAESSARLNLSLMKWRMLPELQLDGLASCSALLLGCGTLGCNVARQLMMWGVRKITLVDRGNVSYSNPVRQTLFELSDVIHPEEEKRNKAIAAANALRRILPAVEAKGVQLNIHMPGHRIDKQREVEATAEIVELDRLIQDHDVVFLLTDSRESRWLPTLMAAAYNKPVLNVALGFDTYLVMRHGVRAIDGNDAARLGCYFCSDVVAPRDSMTARTLDQQCTVTRPGVSAIASATAVEMLAQLYNHPLGFGCPAYAEFDTRQHNADVAAAPAEDNSAICALGIIPQQIRGSVSKHYVYTLHGYRYELCTACSPPMVAMYHKNGPSFVLQCVNDPLYIEEVSGVKAFKDGCSLEDCGEWDIASHDD